MLILGDVRQAVVVDMSFNLGLTRFSQFTQTLKAISAGNYAAASSYMLDSKWARQVGPRAQRLAKMMRTGEWWE